MEWTTVIAYLSVAVLAIAASAALLSITKSPAIITIVAASVAAGVYMIYARLDLGYWDKFAVVAFVVCWAYAFVVSFAFIGIGRLLKRPFFFAKK
jgi:hypothetical protein